MPETRPSAAGPLATQQEQQHGRRPGPSEVPGQAQRSPASEAAMHPRPQFALPPYRGAGKLRDKVALITGGDSGMGGRRAPSTFASARTMLM